MPTHDEQPRFLREYASLTPEQQARFLAAVEKMVEDLRAQRPFRPGLRVKGVESHPGVFEVTWAPDGRATFSYGDPQRAGETHIIWRRSRIGSHDILGNP